VKKGGFQWTVLCVNSSKLIFCSNFYFKFMEYIDITWFNPLLEKGVKPRNVDNWTYVRSS
jgi:hypothetical protein